MLRNTLGCRQGTLYKAPRNSDVKLQDDNVFCKSDFWNLNASKPSRPLALGELAYTLVKLLIYSNASLRFPSQRMLNVLRSLR